MDALLDGVCVVLVLVLAGTALLQVRSTAAQGGEPEPQAGFVDEGLADPAPPVETPAVPTAAEADLSRQRGEAKVYLPMLRGRPQFAAQFATALDERLKPIAPGTAFPRGTSEIYSVLTLNGAATTCASPAWSPTAPSRLASRRPGWCAG